MASRRGVTLVATMLLSVAVLIVGTRPGVPRVLQRVPDWSSHAATYATLGFLSARSAALFGIGFAPVAGGAYAIGHGALLEALQAAVPTRAAEWRDLLADAVGAAIGVSLAAVRRAR